MAKQHTPNIFAVAAIAAISAAPDCHVSTEDIIKFIGNNYVDMECRSPAIKISWALRNYSALVEKLPREKRGHPQLWRIPKEKEEEAREFVYLSVKCYPELAAKHGFLQNRKPLREDENEGAASASSGGSCGEAVADVKPNLFAGYITSGCDVYPTPPSYTRMDASNIGQKRPREPSQENEFEKRCKTEVDSPMSVIRSPISDGYQSAARRDSQEFHADDELIGQGNLRLQNNDVTVQRRPITPLRIRLPRTCIRKREEAYADMLQVIEASGRRPPAIRKNRRGRKPKPPAEPQPNEIPDNLVSSIIGMLQGGALRQKTLEDTVIEMKSRQEEVFNIVKDLQKPCSVEAKDEDGEATEDGRVIHAPDGDYYTLVRQLGVGGFATVHLVKDSRKELFALKMSKMAELSEDMLRGETALYKAIKGIVPCTFLSAKFPLFEVILDGHLFRCEKMEACKIDLYEALAQGFHFETPEIMRVVGQVSSALAFLNNLKFIHSDIKTDNIMFSDYKLIEKDGHKYLRNVEIRVIDFNVVIEKEGEGPMEFRGQSWCYMAPEMALVMPCDERIDVWSLGIIALQMMQLPNGGFYIIDAPEGETELAVRAAVLGEMEALVGQIPTEMKKQSEYAYFRETLFFPRLVPYHKRYELTLTDALDSLGESSSLFQKLMARMLCVDVDSRPVPLTISRYLGYD